MITGMPLTDLREAVLDANRELGRRGLVSGTFGNASGIDRAAGVVAIKPSGVPLDRLRAEDIVVVDLDGRTVAGSLRPSSDTPTHLALYRAWPDIGGVVHTHSTHATAWCQARRDLPCLGTTHADYCHGPVPCTRLLRDDEVASGYELATGTQIIERLAGLDRRAVPMVLVAGHAPFTWGADPAAAAAHAVILEEIARMAWITIGLDPAVQPLPAAIRDYHFQRKHGPNATYGQATRHP